MTRNLDNWFIKTGLKKSKVILVITWLPVQSRINCTGRIENTSNWQNKFTSFSNLTNAIDLYLHWKPCNYQLIACRNCQCQWLLTSFKDITSRHLYFRHKTSDQKGMEDVTVSNYYLTFSNTCNSSSGVTVTFLLKFCKEPLVLFIKFLLSGEQALGQNLKPRLRLATIMQPLPNNLLSVGINISFPGVVSSNIWHISEVSHVWVKFCAGPRLWLVKFPADPKFLRSFFRKTDALKSVFGKIPILRNKFWRFS